MRARGPARTSPPSPPSRYVDLITSAPSLGFISTRSNLFAFSFTTQFGSYRKFGDGMCADANMVGYSFVNFGDFRVKGKVPDDVLGQIIPRIYEIDSAADCPRLCEVAGLNTVGFSYTKSKRRPIPGVDGVKVQSIACSCLVESADLECDDSVKEGIPWECNSDPNGIGPIKFAVKGTGVESVCYENISFKAVSLGQVELPSSKSSKPTPESTVSRIASLGRVTR